MWLSLQRFSKLLRWVIAGALFIIFIPKLASSPIEKIVTALFHWTDDPTGFVIVFFAGFITAVKWPQTGNYILLVDVVWFFTNNYENRMFSLVFLLPVLSIAILELFLTNKRR